MSENESFLHEVSDELRQERTQKYLKKYGWIVGVVALAIIAFVGINEWRTNRANDAAGLQFDTARALDDEDEGAIAVYESLDAKSIPTSVLAAESYIREGNSDKAIAIYETIAASGEAPQFWRDAANLKLADLKGEAVDPLLSNPDQSLRDVAFFTSLEAMLRNGDEDGAKKAIEEFLDRDEVSEDARQIAEDVMLALGGEIPEPLNDANVIEAVGNDDAEDTLPNDAANTSSDTQ